MKLLLLFIISLSFSTLASAATSSPEQCSEVFASMVGPEHFGLGKPRPSAEDLDSILKPTLNRLKNTEFLIPSSTMMEILKLEQSDIFANDGNIELVANVMINAPLNNLAYAETRTDMWIMENPEFLGEHIKLIEGQENPEFIEKQKIKLRSIARKLRQDFALVEPSSLLIYRNDLVFLKAMLSENIATSNDKMSLLYPLIGRLDVALVKNDLSSAGILLSVINQVSPSAAGIIRSANSIIPLPQFENALLSGLRVMNQSYGSFTNTVSQPFRINTPSNIASHSLFLTLSKHNVAINNPIIAGRFSRATLLMQGGSVSKTSRVDDYISAHSISKEARKVKDTINGAGKIAGALADSLGQPGASKIISYSTRVSSTSMDVIESGAAVMEDTVFFKQDLGGIMAGYHGGGKLSNYTFEDQVKLYDFSIERVNQKIGSLQRERDDTRDALSKQKQTSKDHLENIIELSLKIDDESDEDEKEELNSDRNTEYTSLIQSEANEKKIEKKMESQEAELNTFTKHSQTLKSRKEAAETKAREKEQATNNSTSEESTTPPPKSDSESQKSMGSLDPLGSKDDWEQCLALEIMCPKLLNTKGLKPPKSGVIDPRPDYADDIQLCKSDEIPPFVGSLFFGPKCDPRMCDVRAEDPEAKGSESSNIAPPQSGVIDPHPEAIAPVHSGGGGSGYWPASPLHDRLTGSAGPGSNDCLLRPMIECLLDPTLPGGGINPSLPGSGGVINPGW